MVVHAPMCCNRKRQQKEKAAATPLSSVGQALGLWTACVPHVLLEAIRHVPCSTASLSNKAILVRVRLRDVQVSSFQRIA